MKSILFYTIICLAVLIAYLFVERISYRDMLRKNYVLHIFFVLLFACLAWLSIREVNDYVYPRKTQIFCNADYHTLTHFGYKLNDGFTLVDSEHPEKGIWDDRQGRIVLNRKQVHLYNYIDPFYIKEESPKRWTLQNLVCDADVSKGFVLLDGNDSPFYKLEIAPIKRDKNHAAYISHVYRSNGTQFSDTSIFKKVIRDAYPLMEIIRQTPLIHNDTIAILDSVFGNTSLARECVYTESRDKKHRKIPTLRLALSQSFFRQKSFKIQNADCNVRNVITIPYANNLTFYTGIGLSKSDEVILQPADSANLLLSFRQAKRFHFPKWEESDIDSLGIAKEQHLFILSNPQEVVQKDMAKGYLFDEFNDNNNLNNIDAILSYRPGTSREIIDFGIKDNKGEERIENIDINKVFLLNTDNSDCQWIMGVEDLRESNPLTSKKIYAFIIIFFLLVALRILLDKFLQRNSLSITELSIYLVLLCFGVIRLILMWRITTFPPISGITPNVWNVMRSNTYSFTVALFYSIPLIAITISSIYPLLENNVYLQICYEWLLKEYYFLLHKWYNSKVYIFCVKQINGCKQRLSVKKDSHLHHKSRLGYEEFMIWLKNDGDSQFTQVAYFAFSLLFCLVGSKIAGQLFNICIPFICYLIFDWWVIARTNIERSLFNGKINVPIERILLALLLIVHFGISDAGIIPVFGIYLIIKHIIYGVLRRHWRNKKWFASLISVVFAIGLGTALFYEGDLILNLLPQTSSNSYLVRKTRHMRWRAETQRIRSDEDLANLMQECDYDSDDIEMLMRSVHNQWFINQYINLGDKRRDGYLQLQPHSNQGSPYPTQTTDLVITRYVLSEHGDTVVFLMMMIFLALVLIYGLESGLYNNNNFAVFGGLLFLYTIALTVYLSATNRIVFIGQDFPLLSVQSKTAVLFPVLIFIITIFRTAYLRYNDKQFRKETSATQEWVTILLPSLSLVIFSFLTLMIKKANLTDEGQEIDNNSVFNISNHIEKIETAVAIINEDFQYYQDQEIDDMKNIHVQHFDSLWQSFVQDGRYNINYNNFINSSDNKFISSLLQHFTERQRDKNDPEQLLHLRKGNYIYLTVNKHYYFIANIDNEQKQWTGNLLASNDYNTYTHRNNPQRSYKVISNSDLPNTRQIIYESSWTQETAPLYLIWVDESSTQTERFEIINPTAKISSFKHNVMATSVPEFSVVNVYKKDERGKEINKTRNRATQKIETNDDFLSKNIWINGQQQHFYPQDVNKIWAYEFTQWLSQSMQNLSNEDLKKYQNSNVRLTLDMQLSEDFYSQAKKDCATNMFGDFVAVVIDGNGNIRTLFNYAPQNKNIIDPNDSKLMNKRISEMYTEGSQKTMREMFGTSALLPIPAGPGSTLKPIVYTAVTARLPIKWTTLDIKNIANIPKDSVKHTPRSKRDAKASENKELYDYYGGLKLEKALSIENAYGTGQEHSNYILRSNNMYHSVVVMLGMKNSYNFDERQFNSLLKDYNKSMRPTEAFPVISYDGSLKCFNPDVWWRDNKNNDFVDDGSALSLSLFRNFHIQQNPIRNNQYQYSEDYYGNAPLLTSMYEVSSAQRIWASPEQGTQNTADRRNDPIKQGFNQMFLGANPLKLTPLQMAVNTLRLSSLNKAEHITTLFANDNVDDYEFFDIDEGWGGKEKYLKFVQEQVFLQMRQVPKTGTASALKDLALKMEKNNLYLYCKTGTLTQPNKKTNRIKHLMVIISNKELENLQTIEEFKQAKRYVVYFSFYDSNGYTNHWVKPYIEKILSSATFKKYMEE